MVAGSLEKLKKVYYEGEKADLSDAVDAYISCICEAALLGTCPSAET